MPLAESFLEELSKSMGRRTAGISRSAKEWLLAYPWPGNVRELRNAIERAILLCDGGVITNDHLFAPAKRSPATAHAALMESALQSPAESVDIGTMERGLIEKALSQAKGNKSQAARILGLTRAQLYARLEKHGLR